MHCSANVGFDGRWPSSLTSDRKTTLSAIQRGAYRDDDDGWSAGVFNFEALLREMHPLIARRSRKSGTHPIGTCWENVAMTRSSGAGFRLRSFDRKTHVPRIHRITTM